MDGPIGGLSRELQKRFVKSLPYNGTPTINRRCINLRRGARRSVFGRGIDSAANRSASLCGLESGGRRVRPWVVWGRGQARDAGKGWLGERTEGEQSSRHGRTLT